MMKLVFGANILVAGSIGIICLLSPNRAASSIFGSAWPANESMRLVGCFWMTICLLSVAGCFRPERFAVVLLFQLLYKGGWLLAVAAPAIVGGRPYPQSMAGFFVVWVLVLPWAIPWQQLFA